MIRKIYLDNNASTPLDPRVSAAIIQTIPLLHGNPSSIHSFGQKIKSMLSQARDCIASYLKVNPQEIIFTSGGTENANMIIRGVALHKKRGHIITSNAEHSCVYNTMKELDTVGYQISFLPTGLYGAVTPEAVRAAIRPDTILISLMAVNNETGVKTDIEAIANIALEHNIPFFVDAVALLGKESFIIPQGVSAMGFSGHKLHAPQGIGFTFIRRGLKMTPFMNGGEQEFGRRAGTENVLGIVALAKAIEILDAELVISSQHMLKIRDKFEMILSQALPGTVVNGLGPRVVNVSNLAFSGIDGESLVIALDAAGIAASHGSACASGALEPSRILVNMGIPLELVHSSIRFSFSRFTTEEEVEEACRIITRVVQREK